MPDFSLSLPALALYYLLFINLFAFILMGLDKRKAKRGAWRIPERTLFLPVLLGGGAGVIAEANPLHAAGKMPVAAFHGGAHSAGSFCGSLWLAGFGSKLFSRAVPDSSHATNSVIRMTESIGCSTKFSG